MARTQTVSDDEIFTAARNVIARRGAHGFTLTDVAAEVGLSRAAVILRFKSTQALKVQLMIRMADAFIGLLDQLPTTPGGDSLLQVAAFIGRHLGDRKSVPSFFSNYAANMQEPELAEIEKRRGAALRDAILRVMPKTRIDREEAASAFSAHLTGTIMNFVAVEETDSVDFLVRRTKNWLLLAGIPFSAEFTGHTPAKIKPGKAQTVAVKQKSKPRVRRSSK
ncbi:MAG: TetR/AcrR family transcriptional regulator [Halioglobus sp.]|nr:TetR/AcrR family transcriptional regulator [Halioglobus sp.]